MILFSYINLFLITSILPTPKSSPQKLDICNIYGKIFIERQNRNVADFIVNVEQEETFVDLKVFIQENEFYADKPGMWNITSSRDLADFIVFIEKEEGRAKYKIHYTDQESNAGCNR